jgi:hypothetical protein
VGLCHEISETRVTFKLGRRIGVLGQLDDLSVKNVRWVVGAGDPDKGTLTIGAARMCDVPKPSAVLTEHTHGLKIYAAMEHGIYTKRPGSGRPGR